MIKVEGLHKLEAKINGIPNRSMKGVEKGIKIIYEASKPLVPVDTGKLKKSGKITQIKDGYQLQYHSENPKNNYNYAPIQHENLHFNHKVGQAKYLEQAVRSNLDKVMSTISKEVLK